MGVPLALAHLPVRSLCGSVRGPAARSLWSITLVAPVDQPVGEPAPQSAAYASGAVGRRRGPGFASGQLGPLGHRADRRVAVLLTVPLDEVCGCRAGQRRGVRRPGSRAATAAHARARMPPSQRPPPGGRDRPGMPQERAVLVRQRMNRNTATQGDAGSARTRPGRPSSPAPCGSGGNGRRGPRGATCSFLPLPAGRGTAGHDDHEESQEDEPDGADGRPHHDVHPRCGRRRSGSRTSATC
jgi:hypothetical protein